MREERDTGESWSRGAEPFLLVDRLFYCIDDMVQYWDLFLGFREVKNKIDVGGNFLSRFPHL